MTPCLSRGRDTGESLLEILIALAILGTCFASILAGIGTTVLTSGVKQQQSLDTSYLRALAEQVEAAPFQPCTAAAPAYAVSGIAPPGSGYQLAITSVDHWDGDSYEPTCPPVDDLQRITLTVTPPDDRAAEPPLVVLKRRP